MRTDTREREQAQGLCWLLDDLLDAQEHLLLLMSRPDGLGVHRRRRLAQFCEQVQAQLLRH